LPSITVTQAFGRRFTISRAVAQKPDCAVNVRRESIRELFDRPGSRSGGQAMNDATLFLFGNFNRNFKQSRLH
jgi:hypothetical protein